MSAEVVHIRDYLPTYEVVVPSEQPATVIALPVVRVERAPAVRKPRTADAPPCDVES